MKFVLVYTSKLPKLSTIPFISWRIVVLWHTTSTFIFTHQQELSFFVLICASLNNTTLAFLREFDWTLKTPLLWACTMMWDINNSLQSSITVQCTIIILLLYLTCALTGLSLFSVNFIWTMFLLWVTYCLFPLSGNKVEMVLGIWQE